MLISPSMATLLVVLTIQIPGEIPATLENPIDASGDRPSESVVIELPRESIILSPDEKKNDFDGVFGAATFSPDGKLLVMGNTSGVVKIFEPESGRHRLSFRASDPNEDRCHAVAFSPDGRMVAVPAKKLGQVATMDPTSGSILREMQTFIGDPRPSCVQCLAYSRDGKTLAGGLNVSGKTLVWDVSSGRRIQVIPPQMTPGDYKRGGQDTPATVRGVAFSLDGSTLYISGHKLLMWDVQGARPRHSEWPDGAYAGNLRISPDGTLLATIGSFRQPVRGFHELAIVEAATGRILNSVEEDLKEDLFVDAAFSPDNRMILTVVEVGKGRLNRRSVLRLRETSTLRLIATIRFEYRFQIGSLAVSPDGKMIAAGGCSNDHPFGVIGMAEWDGDRIRSWRARP